MVEPKKSLGQHWLNNDKIIDEIVEFSGVKAGNNVLEIGPGEGALSQKLLDRGAILSAVEVDHESIRHLQKRFKGKELFHLIKQDIREFDLSQMPKNYKVVANIPYYLTANLIRKFINTLNKPVSTTLLVQKEVAERLVTKPGKMSLISVLTQAWYDVSLGNIVDASEFTPPPKVDSQVVKLDLRTDPPFGNNWDEFKKSWPEYEKTVAAGFNQPRKKLRSSFAAGMGVSKEVAEEILKKAEIDQNLRAQELTLEQWSEIQKVLDKNKQK
ncbi:MAG: 16S rRNA (adenine(1518)-N(6)/adenine(1519)-N(6))-dimethyltransferase RsmA [bacterium]|nr:16S rRNA (adenine(1518)-N(6)/adenine(1519)-N(6))-dimethyltransferase RsmA [bacterium]